MTSSEALDRVAMDATSGHGRFVVVDGPAGMGKSAVLHELTAKAAGVRRAGAAGRGSHCRRFASAVAVGVDSSAAGRGRPRRDRGGSDGRVGGGAGVARPERRDEPAEWRDPHPSPTRCLLARGSTGRSSTCSVGRTGPGRWLFSSTTPTGWTRTRWALLALAADELVPQGVVVAVALRADEVPEVSDEIDAVAARHRADTVRLPLTGLTDGGRPRSSCAVQNPDSADDALAPALVARTGGNPFFVTELLRLLTSERRLDVASVNTVLPHQVRDVLRRRIDRLPDRTQSLLNVVALLNRPAEVPLLIGVTGLSDEAALDDAEAAVASSLLIEDPASGGFLLSHDLVRQTLEETLSAARLARMHARIAEVMQAEEKQSPTMLPEVVVEIARHLVLAESVVGANAAIPYLIAVADDARSRAAFHLAERALRTALELSARVADPARRTVLQFELRTRLVLQSNVISGPPDSRIFGQDDEPIDQGAISLAETDPLAWWGAQVVRFVEGRSGQALELAEQALARELPDSIKAMVLHVAAICHFATGRFESGRPAVRPLRGVGGAGTTANPRHP